mgnify:FL=1
MQGVVYTNGNQESERLTSLLKGLKIEILEYKLNNHFSQRAFESEFGKGAEYPQCALDYKHIGGIMDTLNHLKKDGLFE